MEHVPTWEEGEEEEERQRNKGTDEMGRGDLTRTMRREHPIVALNVETVAANVKEALEDVKLAFEVKRCPEEAALLVANA
ncbi:hypothetical protein BX616_005860 [Lobosporangium transversale]|nr:hypothetical protein BX616_005860 [Lobosporangium transversale]